MTKDEAQRRRWTFYEAVKIEIIQHHLCSFASKILKLASTPCTGEDPPPGWNTPIHLSS
jgi:hypothetical protein